MHDNKTLSRRLPPVATMAPAATLARADADPVFAAIAAHKQAVRKYDVLFHRASEVGVEERKAAEAASWRAADAEHAALMKWLETMPASVAGCIAKFGKHAPARDESSDNGHLLEGAHYYGERLAAFREGFLIRIAEALRKVT